MNRLERLENLRACERRASETVAHLSQSCPRCMLRTGTLSSAPRVETIARALATAGLGTSAWMRVSLEPSR